MQNEFSEDSMIKYWQLLNCINNFTPNEQSIDKISCIILTFVTSEKGLGFNRAMLMLKSDENILEVVSGIGLYPDAEANDLWSDKSCDDIINSCEQFAKQHTLPELIYSLKVDIKSKESALAKIVFEHQPFLITPEQISTESDKKIVEILQTDTFAVAPLIAQGNVIGIILADNLFTRRSISDKDVQYLFAFAGQTAAAIENIRLYQKLQQLMVVKQTHTQSLQIERHATSGEMSAAIVHELRNPILAIGGFARRLHRNLSDTDENREMTNIIIQETSRLERLLEQMRYLSHLVYNSQEQCDINHIAKDTLKLMEEEITQNDITLRTEFANNSPPVLISEDELKQVLLNIILNAIEAMPNGGELFLKTKQHDVMVEVEITDTGCGIPGEILENIFQPLFTTKSNGSGLGLAISNQIIKAHGGKIQVKSQIDKGTTFLINLPVGT